MLENLLATKLKKKLLSIFLSHPQRGFTLEELRQTAEASQRLTSEAAKDLLRAEAISATTRGRQRFFRANPRFPLYHELHDLIADDLADGDDLVSKFLKKIPNTKVIILSGVFTFEPQLPTDILIVGDNISRMRLGNILGELENLTGLELNYTVMPVEEYEYRKMMSDRFVRDVLDYPHIMVLNLLKTKKK